MKGLRSTQLVTRLMGLSPNPHIQQNAIKVHHIWSPCKPTINKFINTYRWSCYSWGQRPTILNSWDKTLSLIFCGELLISCTRKAFNITLTFLPEIMQMLVRIQLENILILLKFNGIVSQSESIADNPTILFRLETFS